LLSLFKASNVSDLDSKMPQLENMVPI